MTNARPAIYYPQLDALRAIAVLMVVLSHYLAGGPWGDYGVRLFYVLSGFLITSTLIAHREHMQSSGVSWRVVARNFYVRRSLRLFPVFYLALLVYLFMVEVLHLGPKDERIEWLFHFAYLTNVLIFMRGEYVGVLTPYWSLAVEEQFYLLWFWVVLYVRTRQLSLVIGLVILSAPLFRALTYLAGYNFYADVLLPACVDTLGAGALLAVAVHGRGGRWLGSWRHWMAGHAEVVRWAVVTCSIFLLLCSFGFDKNSLPRRLMVNVLSSAVFTYVVFACYQGVGGSVGRLLTNRALIAIGKFSYGVYVYHLLVLLLCREWLTPGVLAALDVELSGLLRKTVDFILPVVLTLLVSRFSWVYFEAPILRLKSRFSEGLGSV